MSIQYLIDDCIGLYRVTVQSLRCLSPNLLSLFSFEPLCLPIFEAQGLCSLKGQPSGRGRLALRSAPNRVSSFAML